MKDQSHALSLGMRGPNHAPSRGRKQDPNPDLNRDLSHHRNQDQSRGQSLDKNPDRNRRRAKSLSSRLLRSVSAKSHLPGSSSAAASHKKCGLNLDEVLTIN